MWHLIKYTAKLGPLGFFKVRVFVYCIQSVSFWKLLSICISILLVIHTLCLQRNVNVLFKNCFILPFVTLNQTLSVIVRVVKISYDGLNMQLRYGKQEMVMKCLGNMFERQKELGAGAQNYTCPLVTDVSNVYNMYKAT